MSAFLDIAREIDRQAGTRVDLRAPGRSIRVQTDEAGQRRVVVTEQAEAVEPVGTGLAVPGLSTYRDPHVGVRGMADFDLHDNGAIQLHDWLGLPDRWGDELARSNPALYDTVVNSLIHQRPPDERRMVRAVDGSVRAVLGDGYLALDNVDLIQKALLPLIEQRDDLEIIQAGLSDTRLYIQITTAKLKGAIRPGEHRFISPEQAEAEDLIQPMVTIRNSEFGNGALAVVSGTFRLACYNGAIVESIVRRRHVGAKVGGEGVLDHDFRLTDETQEARDKALWLTLRDGVADALSPAAFNRMLTKQQDAAITSLVGRPDKVVETVGKTFGLTEEQRYNTLEGLLRGRDLTRFGVAQAITLQAHNAAPDLAYDLQVAGGRILDMSPEEWRQLDKGDK